MLGNSILDNNQDIITLCVCVYVYVCVCVMFLVQFAIHWFLEIMLKPQSHFEARPWVFPTVCVHFHEGKVYCFVPQRIFAEMNVLPECLEVLPSVWCSWKLPITQELVTISLRWEYQAIIECMLSVLVYFSDQSELISLVTWIEFFWSLWDSCQPVCGFVCFYEVSNTKAWSNNPLVPSVLYFAST
jgi:hypothetical protein